MKSIVTTIAICLCIVTIVGCKQTTTPKTPAELADSRISVSLKQTSKKKFYLFAQRPKGITMTWRIIVDANVIDANGHEVPGPKIENDNSNSWFVWKENNYHSGILRSNRILKETLILKKGLPPGTYQLVPSVTIFESGKDDYMKNDPYYNQINGLQPGKIKKLIFTVK